MFFGIFSSLIPYVIAAGFYLVYILISFAHPFLQKTFFEKDISEQKSVSFDDYLTPAGTDEDFNYEDYYSSNDFSESQCNNELLNFLAILKVKIYSPPDLPESLNPDLILFSRPPPSC